MKRPAEYLHDAIKNDCATYSTAKFVRNSFPSQYHAMRACTDRLAKDMAAAKKIVLDNEALRVVCRISNTSDEHLLSGMRYLARLPFESVFVEFDGDERRAIFIENGTLVDDGLGAVGRQGYLIKRVSPDDPTVWRATRYHGAEYGVDASSCSWVVSTDKPISSDNNPLASLAWGINKAIPDHMAFAIRHEPSDVTRTLRHTEAELKSDVESGAIDGMGTVRLLITFLTMMDTVPMDAVHREPQHTRLVGGGKRVKYDTHSRIKLNLTRRNSIFKVIKSAIKAHRRRHEVRGHWRNWRDEDGKVLRSVWIEKHERGDAALGWVHHSYDITAKVDHEKH
jgi:hypothetical protein